jgi:hypothetical protein
MRDALQDVRQVLEGAAGPLTTGDVVERLAGEHDPATVEHLIKHFQHERKIETVEGGGWAWVAPAPV